MNTADVLKGQCKESSSRKKLAKIIFQLEIFYYLLFAILLRIYSEFFLISKM